MKPHPHIRRTIKWGGLALCLLLAGVWVRSEWVLDDYCGGAWQFRDWRGSIVANRCSPPARRTGWVRVPVSSGAPRVWRWMSGRTVYNSLGWQVVDYWVVPLWIPLAPTLLATAAAWRLDALARRRARVGVCPKCHYDRTGLAASAVCPECGASPA